jgi:hypothetical protein
MDLVERYLQSVRFLLPRRQRDDVHRELAEDLAAEIEAREEAAGRPLGEEELTAVLQRFGHPLALALRYQPARSLVGPETFPILWFAVRHVLAILVVVHVVLPSLFLLATGDGGGIVGLFLRFPGVAVPVLFWLIVGAAVLDAKPVRGAIAQALARWKPQDLPPVVKDETATPPSVAATVGVALLGTWWLVGLRNPWLLLGPAASAIAFGPVFHRLAPLVAVATVARVAVDLVRIARPHRRRFARAGSLAVDALSVAMVFLLSRGGPDWIVALRPDQAGNAGVASAAAGLGLAIAFVVAAATFAWKCVRAARTLPR